LHLQRLVRQGPAEVFLFALVNPPASQAAQFQLPLAHPQVVMAVQFELVSVPVPLGAEVTFLCLLDRLPTVPNVVVV
jgi:hypothetical protein